MVASIPKWQRGIRGLRFVTHRLAALVAILKQQHADVFYVRGFSYWYMVPLLVSKYQKAVFVLAIAHDSDLLNFRARRRLFYSYNSVLWEWISNYLISESVVPIVLRFADIVLVQHEMQKVLAMKKHINACVFRNIIEEQSTKIIPAAMRTNFVFVGEVNVRKGLPEMLAVISQCPEQTFEIIGPATDSAGDEAYKAMQKLSNTLIQGQLSHEETLQRIAHARALVNTSPMEGFPNTFLEAWSVGTPVLSLIVDPDAVIERFKLGYCCHGNIEVLREKIVARIESISPDAMRKYLENNHSFHTAAERFGAILTQA